MTLASDNELESQIAEWRAYMRRRRELHPGRHRGAGRPPPHQDHRADRGGPAGDEAFLIAVKRMGSLDELSREFAREHSERLWKQLVLPGEPNAAAARSRRELVVMMLCAAVAALAIKVPACSGLTYRRAMPASTREPAASSLCRRGRVLRLAAPARPAGHRGARVLFIVGAVARMRIPGRELTDDCAHGDPPAASRCGWSSASPMWAVTGARPAPMDFIRFTGEWLIYFVLIGWAAASSRPSRSAPSRPSVSMPSDSSHRGCAVRRHGRGRRVGMAGEAKQSVIENMAPVLTRVFTPLFVAALLALPGRHDLDQRRESTSSAMC
jgi:hypothetical protein